MQFESLKGRELSPRDFMELGRVGRPHGVRGELRLTLFNKESDALRTAKHLYLVSESGQLALGIETVRGKGAEPIVALEGVIGRDAAESLRGARVFVARSELPALEEGEYYLVDTLGLTVRCGDEVLGQVESVRPDPTVDTLVIRLQDGRIAQQPLLDAFVARVDVSKGVIELTTRDGLIDD